MSGSNKPENITAEEMETMIFLSVDDPEACAYAISTIPINGVGIVVNFKVPQGYVGMVGSFDGRSNFCKAFGSGNYSFIVTKGFGTIIPDRWAQSQWELQVRKANYFYGNSVYIDSGPLVLIETETNNTTEKVRVETIDNEWTEFFVGDSVVGSTIEIDDFTTFEMDPKGYLLFDAKIGGKVKHGVVNPYPEEITNQTVIIIPPEWYNK